MTTYSPKFTIKITGLYPSMEKAVLTDDVVSVTTSKAYGRQAGTWQITATYRKNKDGKRLNEIIIPNDYVEIAMNRGGPGDVSVVVMAGLVSRVSVLRHVTTEGEPARTIQISGEDLGKLLSAQIGWDISPAQLNRGSDIYGSYAKRYVLMADTPANMVYQVFQIFTETCPVAGILIECGEWLTTDDDWKLLNPNGYLVAYTPAWGALKRLENDPWNTLYCDTDDKGYFHIGLEKQPFDTMGKIVRPDSKTVTIDDVMVMADDLGVSDAERINLLALSSPIYSYVPTDNPIDLVLVDPMMTHFDPESINVHGYHPQVFETEYVPQDISEQMQDCDPAKRVSPEVRSETFWNWFKNNHTYESGSVTIHGDPRIRAGWKLIHKGKNMAYLIEHVGHTFEVGGAPSFTTTLQVTRGTALS